jgi:hypothetical protein
MIRDEAWLELSEVSVTTLEALEAQQPHRALHLFQEGNKSALASVVVQAVEMAWHNTSRRSGSIHFV